MILHFTIPGTPVPMQRVVPFGGGKPYTEKKSRAAMKNVQRLAMLALAGRPLLQGPLKITVEAVFERPPSWPKSHGDAKWHTNKPDAKNVLWLVEDALNQQVWHDDSQLAVTISFKRYGTPERTVVTIEQLPELGSYKAPKPKAKTGQHALDISVGGRPIIGGTR